MSTVEQLYPFRTIASVLRVSLRSGSVLAAAMCVVIASTKVAEAGPFAAKTAHKVDQILHKPHGVPFQTGPSFVGPADLGLDYDIAPPVHPVYQQAAPGNWSRRRPPRPRPAVLPQGFQPYFRLNYLIGDFTDPGNQRVGAQQAVFSTATAIDPQFQVVFNGAAVQLPADSPFSGFAVGEPVDLGDFTMDGANGIEGTMGIPLTSGTIELSAMAFDQVDAGNTFTPSRTSGLISVFPAIPVTDIGVPSDTLAIPFEELTLKSTIDYWGAGAQFVLNPITPNLPLTFSPTIGARYFKYREGFFANGRFRDITTITLSDPLDIGSPLTDPVEFLPSITSRTTNHIFGPTLGLRAQLNGPIVTISAEPRLGVAVNRAFTDITTSQLFSITQAETVSEKESELAPFFEFDVNASIQVSPSFSLFAGYKLVAMSRIRRAEQQIFYDTIGGAANFATTGAEDEVVFQSLMFGGEVTLGRPSTGR